VPCYKAILETRSKKFNLFNYHVIEKLGLIPKVRFVKSISGGPKAIAADRERLNGLRNCVAHSFFPENLKKQKPVRKGKPIFTSGGLNSFYEDVQKDSGTF